MCLIKDVKRIEMETMFKISTENGAIIATYREKEEFINDCIGDRNLEFGSEIFKISTVFPWKNHDLKITDIDVEFESILDDRNERISDYKRMISKTIIVVTIFIIYI